MDAAAVPEPVADLTPAPTDNPPDNPHDRAEDRPELPEPVWERLVALTAEVLPAVTPLPTALRRLAAFAPARRARLGATPISLALTRDGEFRTLVAERLAEALPELAEAVRSADVPGGADPVDAAALTWLVRPDGWSVALAGHLERVEDRSAQRRRSEEDAELDRLREALAEAEQAQRDLRARTREQTETLKAENASLRRKLGEARVKARAAEAEAARATTAALAATDSVEAATASAEAQVRRLAARVAELEQTAGAGRRELRSQRDDTSLRARLLLDALLEAGQGLRRELGLPAAEGAPADRLEEELRATGQSTGEAAAASSGAPVSAGQLEGWLQMPRARLLVDGYNVSKTRWSELSLDLQRTRLLAELAPLVARSGAETTVVFDAASSDVRPPVNPPRGLKVLFSPPGVIADDVLRDLVAVEPPGRTVVVVSSDGEVMRDVRRAGARAVPSEVLLSLLTR